LDPPNASSPKTDTLKLNSNTKRMMGTRARGKEISVFFKSFDLFAQGKKNRAKGILFFLL